MVKAEVLRILDLMDGRWKERALFAWERAVREEPRVAALFGPPSWLVLERQEKGEEFLAAAARVRGEYGLGAPGVPTGERLSLQNVPTKEGVPTCEVCGEKPREGRYRVCSGCRKAAQRHG